MTSLTSYVQPPVLKSHFSCVPTEGLFIPVAGSTVLPCHAKRAANGACFNPYPAKFFYLNFHQLEVVSRYRDPQLQEGENYSYLFNLRPNIWKSFFLNTNFIPNTCNMTTVIS